jgi:hypothetical protein
MNAAHFIIATITLSAASAAFAADSSTTTAAAASAAPAAAAIAVTVKPQGLTREQVMAEFYEARKNGTLIQSEADMDVAQTRKQFAK